MNTVLEASQLSVIYRSRKRSIQAIDRLDLQVAASEFVALLGPNGSGKSTLLKVMARLQEPTSGRIQRPSQSHLGVVFQTPALDPRLSVRANLMDLARLQGLDHATADARIRESLDQLSVSDRAGDPVGTLSGGLARRVDLARAMLHEPEVLLLDEPTAGLDPVGRQLVLDHLRSVNESQGTTILMSTHLVDEAAAADRVVLMHQGRCIVDGSPAGLCEAIGAKVLRVDQRCHTPADPENWSQFSTWWWRPVTGPNDPIVQTLLAQGIDFSIAAPTLADVFREATGTPLIGTRFDEEPEVPS